MKTLMLAVVLWVSGMIPAFGQGVIRFDSYNSHDGNGVLTTFGAGVVGHPAGLGLTYDWTAGLLYSLSPITEAATAGSEDVAAQLNGAWLVAPNTAIYAYSTGGADGYFVGPNFIVSDGVDGQVVYFEVIAFETGAAGADSAERYMNSTVRGHSATFTGVLRPFGNLPNHMDNLQSFSAFTVPEPSALALTGLGLAALLAYRRKHA